MQKHENYKVQMNRLKKAIDAKFYLEAVFIEYAIIEDRFDSAICHSGVINDGKFASLNAKLNKMANIAREKKSLACKYFNQEIFERVKLWKDERNRIIHALMKQSLTTEKLRVLAEEGQAIVKHLCSITTSYNRKLTNQNK